MTYIDTLQTLASAFILGNLLQLGLGLKLGFLAGYARILLQHQKRLALVVFLATAALWAKLAFLDFAMPTLRACQATIVLSTLADQLARTFAVIFILSVAGGSSETRLEKYGLVTLIAIRSIFGVVFLGLTRPQLGPLCIPRSDVLEIAIMLLIMDALLIGVMAARQLRTGVWKETWCLPCTTRKEQNKANIYFTSGYAVWYVLSIPKLLGIPRIPLFVRVALPAIGLYIMLFLIDFYRGALLHSLLEDEAPKTPSLERFPHNGADGFTRDFESSTDDLLRPVRARPKSTNMRHSQARSPLYPTGPRSTRAQGEGWTKILAERAKDSAGNSRNQVVLATSNSGKPSSSIRSPLRRVTPVRASVQSNDTECTSGSMGRMLRSFPNIPERSLSKARTASSKTLKSLSPKVLSPRAFSPNVSKSSESRINSTTKALPKPPESPQSSPTRAPMHAHTVSESSQDSSTHSAVRRPTRSPGPHNVLHIPLPSNPPNELRGQVSPARKGLRRKEVPSSVQTPPAVAEIVDGNIEGSKATTKMNAAGKAAVIKDVGDRPPRISLKAASGEPDISLSMRDSGWVLPDAVATNDHNVQVVMVCYDEGGARDEKDVEASSHQIGEGLPSVLHRSRFRKRSDSSSRAIFPRRTVVRKPQHQKSRSEDLLRSTRSELERRNFDGDFADDGKHKLISSTDNEVRPKPGPPERFPRPASPASISYSTTERTISTISVPRTPASQLPPTPPLEIQGSQQGFANSSEIRTNEFGSEPITPMPPTPTSTNSVSLPATPRQTEGQVVGEHQTISKSPPSEEEVTLVLDSPQSTFTKKELAKLILGSNERVERARSCSAPTLPSTDTSWHHRVGDRIPTFSKRCEHQRSRSMTPPPALLLSPEGRSKTEKTPPLDAGSPRRYIQAMRARLRKHEPAKEEEKHNDHVKSSKPEEAMSAHSKITRKVPGPQRVPLESTRQTGSGRLQKKCATHPRNGLPKSGNNERKTTGPRKSESGLLTLLSRSVEAVKDDDRRGDPTPKKRSPKANLVQATTSSPVTQMLWEPSKDQAPQHQAKLWTLQAATNKRRRASESSVATSSTAAHRRPLSPLKTISSRLWTRPSASDSSKDELWMTTKRCSKTILIRRPSHRLRRRSLMRSRRVTFLPEIHMYRMPLVLDATQRQTPTSIYALPSSPQVGKRASQVANQDFPVTSSDPEIYNYADDGFDESTIWEIAALLQPPQDGLV
ncbi:MAG: hypothetical protein M1833_001671 [Piccolia ochrophora]|nr:MAG: hypothetical protein M1833_001671 [Piccolia ochrophora]